MPRTLHRLSNSTVTSSKKPGLYGDGGGLYLRVAAGGSKGWIYRYNVNGKTRDTGLGAFPTVSLAAARARAGEFRRIVAEGGDPIEMRKAQKEEARRQLERQRTFAHCANDFIESHESAWRSRKHRDQWHSTLRTYAFPNIGALPVQEIGTEEVLHVLKPIWLSRTETASRLRQRIERILSWATVRGFRDGANPARWRGHLDELLPPPRKIRKVVHHAALPYLEVPTFLGTLREQDGISARALEFLVLTTTRTSETLGATWSEIDWDTCRWVIPDRRMKAGTSHRIPLGSRALEILSEMADVRTGDFIFPGAKSGRPLSTMSLLMLLRRMDYGHVTSHGFRSSFRVWAAERTTFPREIAEAALAHQVSNAVESAYMRSDLLEKRRLLMAEWDRFCWSQAFSRIPKTTKSAASPSPSLVKT